MLRCNCRCDLLHATSDWLPFSDNQYQRWRQSETRPLRSDYPYNCVGSTGKLSVNVRCYAGSSQLISNKRDNFLYQRDCECQREGPRHRPDYWSAVLWIRCEWQQPLCTRSNGRVQLVTAVHKLRGYRCYSNCGYYAADDGQRLRIVNRKRTVPGNIVRQHYRGLDVHGHRRYWSMPNQNLPQPMIDVVLSSK